jgi:hypothetical protein
VIPQVLLEMFGVTSIQQTAAGIFLLQLSCCFHVMKNLKTIFLVTGLLVAGFGFQVVAQNRAEKTSSAKAYYGHAPEKSKFKKKKLKSTQADHNKPAYGTHIDAWNTRKKYSRS